MIEKIVQEPHASREEQPEMERLGSKSADLLKKLLELDGISRELSRPPFGGLLKWPTRADCKSAGLRLRWFESITHHHFPERESNLNAAGAIRYVRIWQFKRLLMETKDLRGSRAGREPRKFRRRILRQENARPNTTS
jgi:hypothetical protein